MNPWLVVILVLFALAILWIVRQARKAGPRELDERDLQLASPLVRVTASDPAVRGGGNSLARGADMERRRGDQPLLLLIGEILPMPNVRLPTGIRGGARSVRGTEADRAPAERERVPALAGIAQAAPLLARGFPAAPQ